MLERSETHTCIKTCKVRLWQHLHYDYIIIEELLHFREYFFQLSCLLDNGVRTLYQQFFSRI